MKDINQLFRALRNTEPKFDYHSEMNGTEFVHKNLAIFQHAIARCEMTDVNIGDMIEVAKKLLAHLPHKPGINYARVRDEDSPGHEWASKLGELGSKRDKKG